MATRLTDTLRKYTSEEVGGDVTKGFWEAWLDSTQRIDLEREEAKQREITRAGAPSHPTTTAAAATSTSPSRLLIDNLGQLLAKKLPLKARAPNQSEDHWEDVGDTFASRRTEGWWRHFIRTKEEEEKADKEEKDEDEKLMKELEIAWRKTRIKNASSDDLVSHAANVAASQTPKEPSLGLSTLWNVIVGPTNEPSVSLVDDEALARRLQNQWVEEDDQQFARLLHEAEEAERLQKNERLRQRRIRMERERFRRGRLLQLHGRPIDVDSMSYEELLALEEEIGEVKQKGATKQEVNNLPLSVFEQDVDHPRCSICLTDFEKGDTLRNLPCKHKYHKECADKWLSLKKTCPICQTPICA